MNRTVDIPMGAGESRLLPVVGAELIIATEAHGWFGRLLARRLGLPTARIGATVGSLRIDAESSIELVDQRERWTRTFGRRTWTSTLAPGPNDTIVEHAGPLALDFDVHLDDRWNTHMALRKLRIGAAPTPLAHWLDIEAVIERDGTTLVTMRALGGRCSYRATPARSAVPEPSVIPVEAIMPEKVDIEVVR